MVSCTNMKNESLDKHPLDKFEVRTTILDNGLKVILVSDPTFNISAASLSARVGLFDSPDSRLGTPHFIEHMFKMGTEKYPDLDEFNTYLASNGGRYNAYTTTDHTNYHFQILPEAMKGALERFSDRFINPLFPSEYVKKEVNAVNSEHQMGMMNDNRREMRISQLFVRDGHPFGKFGVGNSETLGEVTRDEVVSFFENYYSSNQMALSILGTQSLDTLESWARNYFKEIQNRQLQTLRYPEDVYIQNKSVRTVFIESVKDIRNLRLYFPVADLRLKYESKPGRLFGNILGNEGRGSLLSYLKKQNLATSLSAGAMSYAEQIGFATISIELTDEGKERYKDVLKIVMQYIDLMKKDGYRDDIYNEIRTMAQLDEIYSEKGEGIGRATSYAREALFYPLEYAGRINFIFQEKGKSAYEHFLSQINPEYMFVSLSAKDMKTDKTEYYYNTNYAYIEDEKLYEEIIALKQNNKLSQKLKNQFIPRSASIPGREHGPFIEPKVLVDSENERVYFGIENEFLRPKGVITYKIFFPEEAMNPLFRVMLKTYIKCVNETLNEIAYPAKEAGLNYSIVDGYEGIYITVNGYRESALELFKTIAEHLIHYEISNIRFNAVRDKISREYENFYLSDAWNITRTEIDRIYRDILYEPRNLNTIIGEIGLSDIKVFSKTIYKSVYLEGFIYGDFSENEALESLRVLKEKLDIQTSAKKEQTYQAKYLRQEKAGETNIIKKLQVNNSCFWREYFLGSDRAAIRAAAAILNQAIKRPFFTEMRTNQQLGYIVWSGTRRIDDFYNLFFVIQSGVYSADELNARAEDYINKLPDIVSELDGETFESLRKSSIEELEKKPKTIYERAMKSKDIIFEFESHFGRDNETIDALKIIQQSDVVNFLGAAINEATRKMVTGLSFAKNHDNTTKVKSSFSNLDTWKASRVYE